MHLAIVTSRYPGLGTHGDQGVLFSYLLHLGEHHQITVVVAEDAPSTQARAAVERLACVHVVQAGRLERAWSALGAALRGQPAQVGWMMPRRAWREAQRVAARADVALVITSRSCRGSLPVPTVIDHVDAMSYNMASRAGGRERIPVRLVARFEAWRMKAWERRLARWCAAQLGTTPEVTAMLPAGPPTFVFPVSYAHPIEPDPPGHRRDIDLVFTGDMSYPPNREAAELLTSEILPRILCERPSTSMWIVGRNASQVKSPDVTTASDVPDLHAYLRRAKVAIAPVCGAGSPYKTLEAAANGAALVSAKWAVDCYGLPASTASDPDGFARSALILLEDDKARQEQASAARAVAETLSTEANGERLEAVLARALERNLRSGGTTIQPAGLGGANLFSRPSVCNED